jgi:Protein of unknown function (DUF2490)
MHFITETKLMNNTLKRCFIIICSLFFAKKTVGQTTGLWLKLDAEKAITKKLELDLSAQARYNELKAPADNYIVDVGLKYTFKTNIWAAIYYRRNSNLKKRGYETIHRFYTDLGYKFKGIKPLLIDYRFRYQQQFKDEDTGLVSDKDYIRNKIGVTFKNKSKFEPSFSVDLFYRVGNNFDQIRYRTTLEYQFTKKQNIEIGYQIDDEINSFKSSKNRIFLGYKISL